MGKKKVIDEDAFLIMPEVHSPFNDDELETAFLDKARELIGAESTDEDVSFMLLAGNFFDAKGYTYSAIRDWRGALKPSEKGKRKPILDATFACLSVYLSSLVSFQCDFLFAFEEIKTILLEQEREDLWTIIEEKLPFVSLPPQEMFPEGLKSPISPYYTIQADSELTLGELYPSVYLSNVVKSLKSRFFAFFTYEGNSAFAYFNVLPKTANFGFESPAKPFEGELSTENLIKYIKASENIKDIFVALIQAHNNSKLEQYLIPDYESLLNRLLSIKEVDEGES